MFLWLGVLPLVRTEELHWGIMSVCVAEAHAIDAFKCFLNSLHLMLHYNCLFFYAASAKGIVVFSDDSKYFTDE